MDNGNSLHTFEELVGLSINDLNLLYTSLITAPAEPSTGGGTSGSGTAETAPAIQSSGQASDSAYIGVEAAKSAAFAHAGLDASQVTMGEVDFDYEDGRMVYELEFYANGAEYEYDIDASTGAVVKSSQEGGRPQTGSGAGIGGASGNVSSGAGSGTAQSGAGGTSADIGREAALAAALNHAGVSQDQVYGLEVKQEYDDGRLEYEIEFKTGGWEYEYTISAADGAILAYERGDGGRQKRTPLGGGCLLLQAVALLHQGADLVPESVGVPGAEPQVPRRRMEGDHPLRMVDPGGQNTVCIRLLARLTGHSPPSSAGCMRRSPPGSSRGPASFR